MLGLLIALGAIRAAAPDVLKAFDRVWYAVFLQKLKSDGISGQIFSHSQEYPVEREYPVDAGVPQSSFLDPELFLLYIYELPDDVICNIAIYADVTALYSKCDQASGMWQKLEFASELESDLRDTVDWGRKWLVEFNAGKTQLFFLTCLITLVLMM